ncbi:MAG: AAA family ATPase [Firmicutes bacterium]|nr:AAA family ATPase [Bacillota bacterium]
MENTDRNQQITKISQVTPEVTLFLRGLGFSDYYIIKIFALVGEAAIALTEDNPYWLLDEFPAMKFDKADKAAKAMGIEEDSSYRIEAAIRHGLSVYVAGGNTFVAAREFCAQIAGFLDLSRESVEDVMEDMALTGDLHLTVLGGREVLYFYGYYKTECQIISRIARMADAAPPKLFANMDAVIAKAEAEGSVKLSAQQTDAVKNSLCRGISVITGGPGTGKTTIINTLINIMEAGGLKVAVAAPTGRAAKRITQTGGKAAVTVHRLLEYYYDEEARSMAFGRNAYNPLDYDVVIIDEASMMDLMLMGAVCRALKPESRLIMTGDADQLPSVGAGNVLGDLIESGYIYTSRLTEIYRQESESKIVLNAHRINQGRYPEYGGDFVLVSADKQQEILQKIIELASRWPLDQVQVLTPTKKGILGSLNLNENLQKVFNPPGKEKAEISFGAKIYRTGDRVMQIKNNYRLEYRRKDGKSGKGIFNGETGTVSAVYPDDRKLVVEYDDDRWVEYPYVQLDEIELAYAVTVHKSQGSEFPVVIIPMSWFPPALATRNLIYTAVTRGKRKVVIVGRGDYFNAMVDNVQTGRRNSGLKERLINIYEGI